MEREALEMALEEDETVRMVIYRDDFEQVLDELQREGWGIKRTKMIDTYKVMYMRMIFHHILEGPTAWPSSMLPLIPVLGRHINLENSDSYIGLVRYAHDPQRMFNFWASAATERVALSPRNPYIAPAAAVQAHLHKWENMYTRNDPVLLYDFEPDMPPPRREASATMPAAELQLLGQSRMTLMDTVGMHDASLGRKSNETSGVAIARRQQSGDTSTFEFLDNTAFAVVRAGEVMVDMIPRIYTQDQARRIVLPDDSTVYLNLNHAVTDRQTGQVFKINSLNMARYGCRVQVGPASTTQREEFVELMMEWGRTDPEAFRLIRDLVVANMDFPFAREIAMRLKATVPRHLLSPDEQRQIPPPEPTPEQQLEMAKAEAEKAKYEADKVKAQADIRIAELRLETEKVKLEFTTERGLNREEEQRDIARAKAEAEGGEEGADDAKVEAMVKRFVAQALAERS